MKTVSSRWATVLLLGQCLWPAAALRAADPYAQLPAYRWNQPRTAVLAIEAEIRAAQPGQLPAVEARLLQVLQSPAATPDAKAWICRALRLAGSDQSIPVLAPLLLDKELSSDALFALRCLPGPKADAALRQALPNAPAPLKVGLILVLGARGDRLAVPLLAPLAGDADPAVAEAALDTLGRIGGEAALAALQAAPAPGNLRRARQHALLLAAESVLAEGKAPLAAATCRTLFRQNDDVMAPAALRGLVMAEKSAPELPAALTSDSPVLRAAAARLVSDSGDVAMITAVMARLDSYAPAVQITLLGAINHPAALPAVRTAAESPSAEIRVAALAALGRVGDASSVPLLVRTAAAGPGPARTAARASLLTLRGAGVQEALLASAQAGESASRTEAIQALSGRNAKGCAEALVKLAADPEASVRAAALSALGVLAEAKDLPALAALMTRAGADRDKAEDSLTQATLRMPDRDAAVALILEALAGATPENQAALLRVAAHVPGPKSLSALRAALKNADAGVRDAAVRGLADWPDAAPLADLAAMLRSPSGETHRVLALRGLVRMASALPPAQAAPPLAEALALCQAAPEKKQVLGALPGVPSRATLELAVSCLGDQALELEAATAAASLARKLQATEPEASRRAVQKIREVCTTPEARLLAEDPRLRLAGMVNIASRGKASSPDGLEKDGEAGGDPAAIDGNPATYWDEADGAGLYRLVVEFPAPERISALSLTGYRQHDFAPKDFEILCDGKPVRKITGAAYEDNFLVVPIEEVSARTVELKITGYYGGSPAIRELGIYQRVETKKPQFSVLVFSKTLGFRHGNIPLGVAAIRQLGQEHGFAVDATEDSAVFTVPNLARYKAVVFLSVTGDVLDSAQEAAFKDYVMGGGGFAAIHGALFGPSACEEKWAWYGEVCCTAFKNHSAVLPARVDVEDPQNPSTQGLPARWARTDEWYNYSANPRACARVLATLDETTYQGGTLGEDHPISWCRQMGKGVVWYTAMGHTDASFQEPLFLRHLLGGIQLAAGARTGDLSPRAKPAPAQP